MSGDIDKDLTYLQQGHSYIPTSCEQVMVLKQLKYDIVTSTPISGDHRAQPLYLMKKEYHLYCVI